MSRNKDLENRVECLEKGHDRKWDWEISHYPLGAPFLILNVKIRCCRCGAVATVAGGKKYVKAMRLMADLINGAKLSRKESK